MEAVEIVRHWLGIGSCHGIASEAEEGLKKIVLVGSAFIRCPRCGYEFLAESSLERLIKKWRRKHAESKGRGNS